MFISIYIKWFSHFNSYFSSDRIKSPAQSDWVHKVYWTISLLNIDKFWRRFHIIEKHDKRAKLLILIYDFYDVLVPVVALCCKTSYCKKTITTTTTNKQQQKNQTCARYEYITDWSHIYLRLAFLVKCHKTNLYRINK